MRLIDSAVRAVSMGAIGKAVRARQGEERHPRHVGGVDLIAGATMGAIFGLVGGSEAAARRQRAGDARRSRGGPDALARIDAVTRC
jgi:hypothetical protein